MKLLSALFSANKRKWLTEMPQNKYEENEGVIIKNFMIVDNISYQKYKANAIWENSKLSVYQNQSLLSNCTPSYRKFFSDGYSSQLNNPELGHANHWFYMAYPDVAHWFEENYEEISLNLKRQGVEFSPYEQKNLQVFRYVVTLYKNKFRKLELEM